MNLILSHVAGEEVPVTVLLGDFNKWFLMGRPLRWLHRHFGISRAMRAFPSRFPLLAFNRVWFHPLGSLGHCAAVDTALTRWASDHLPAVADLDLRAPLKATELGGEAHRAGAADRPRAQTIPSPSRC